MRYMIRFSKQGYMRYTSHLDMIRLFQRAFKRMDIPLQHSQGFNPHPRMSFAQPLSLGYSSVGEYLEFETVSTLEAEEILERMRQAVPEGIAVADCIRLPQTKKNVAALVTWGDYILSMPADSGEDWPDKVQQFLDQDEILMEKRKKKGRGKITVEVDIKPMIASLKALPDCEGKNERLTLAARIACGSDRNLNPEAMLQTFASFAQIPFAKEDVHIERREIYFTDWEKTVKPVSEIENELL